PALQAGCQQFDPVIAHQTKRHTHLRVSFFLADENMDYEKRAFSPCLFCIQKYLPNLRKEGQMYLIRPYFGI
ncbi:hypothetical protein, partial [uncultured Megasphaera sp.]|uniref:hypothetical protein n=1 Tax=uncultured Megasphaera sp. TaxID=165188 RepID=UPI00265849C7